MELAGRQGRTDLREIALGLAGFEKTAKIVLQSGAQPVPSRRVLKTIRQRDDQLVSSMPLFV